MNAWVQLCHEPQEALRQDASCKVPLTSYFVLREIDQSKSEAVVRQPAPGGVPTVRSC
jgi:hypothetical protein